MAYRSKFIQKDTKIQRKKIIINLNFQSVQPDFQHVGTSLKGRHVTNQKTQAVTTIICNQKLKQNAKTYTIFWIISV